MFKKLFSRKKLHKSKEEVVSVSEIEMTLQNIIKEREGVLSEFISNMLPDLGVLIQGLILEIDNLDASSMHPRLKGAARNFKSSSIELWGRLDLNNFEQIENAMKKTVIMKLKHFRILFGVNPPELEAVNQKLTEIASKIEEVTVKKADLKLDELSDILNELREFKDVLKKEKQILDKVGRIRKSIKKMENEDTSHFGVDDMDLTEFENEVKMLEEKIQFKDKEIQKKIAIVRKPLKMYFHMVGSNVKDFDFSNDNMAVMASKTISEIRKGNIKVKEKQLKGILESLADISAGNVMEGLKEIRALKVELVEKKNALNRAKLKAGMETPYEGKKAALIREIKSCEKRLMGVREEISVKKETLEKKINDCLNASFKIELLENKFYSD